jgi:hypothetical protein
MLQRASEKSCQKKKQKNGESLWDTELVFKRFNRKCETYRNNPDFFFCRAGKPTTGLHLDVTKDGKLIQVTFVC